MTKHELVCEREWMWPLLAVCFVLLQSCSLQKKFTKRFEKSLVLNTNMKYVLENRCEIRIVIDIETNSKCFNPVVPSKHIFFLTCYMVFIQREGWEQEHILFIPFFVRTSLVTLVVTAIADAASTKCGHQDVISVPARFHTIKRSKKAKVKSSS